MKIKYIIIALLSINSFLLADIKEYYSDLIVAKINSKIPINDIAYSDKRLLEFVQSYMGEINENETDKFTRQDKSKLIEGVFIVIQLADAKYYELRSKINVTNEGYSLSDTSPDAQRYFKQYNDLSTEEYYRNIVLANCKLVVDSVLKCDRNIYSKNDEELIFSSLNRIKNESTRSLILNIFQMSSE